MTLRETMERQGLRAQGPNGSKLQGLQEVLFSFD